MFAGSSARVEEYQEFLSDSGVRCDGMNKCVLEPLGTIRSEIKNKEDAPLFYTERAPNAQLELSPSYWDGIEGMKVGDEIIVITWLHRADRDALKVHPRGDVSRPLTGVFLTRSGSASQLFQMVRNQRLRGFSGRQRGEVKLTCDGVLGN